MYGKWDFVIQTELSPNVCSPSKPECCSGTTFLMWKSEPVYTPVICSINLRRNELPDLGKDAKWIFYPFISILPSKKYGSFSEIISDNFY